MCQGNYRTRDYGWAEGKTQAGTLSGWTTAFWWMQSSHPGVLVSQTGWATAWRCTAAVTLASQTGLASLSATISATASSPRQVKYSTMHYIMVCVSLYCSFCLNFSTSLQFCDKVSLVTHHQNLKNIQIFTNTLVSC